MERESVIPVYPAVSPAQDVQTVPAAQREPQPLSAGQVPDIALSASVNTDGTATLPSLTLYTPNQSETLLFKPGNLSQREIADAAVSAGNLGNEPHCVTCSERTYVDQSDDAGVSMQTPTQLSPAQAASAVMSHEMEHVTRNAAKADREGRRVVGSTVTIHTDNCPECGRSYVSGGTTRTTTVNDNRGENRNENRPKLAEELRGSLMDEAG
jgi:hypothetical protein